MFNCKTGFLTVKSHVILSSNIGVEINFKVHTIVLWSASVAISRSGYPFAKADWTVRV